MTRKELDERINAAFAAFSKRENINLIEMSTTILKQCIKYDYNRGIGGCHALLARIYMRKNEWNIALEEAKNAYYYINKTGDGQYAAHLECTIASIYSEIEQSSIAIEHCLKALKDFQLENDKRGEADACSLLGTILVQKAEYETSLEYLQRSLDIKLQYNDHDGAGSEYINIAVLYLFQNEIEKAIGYLRQAITLKELYKTSFESNTEGVGIMDYIYSGYVLIGRPNDGTIADAYLNLGSALSMRGYYIDAVEALDKALKMKQNLNDRYGEAVAYNQIGTIFIETNDLSKAEWYFLQARPLFESLGHRHSEGTVWYNLGKIYLHSERLTEAKYSLEKAEELFKGLDILFDELFIVQQKASLAIKTVQFILADQLIQRGLEVSRAIEAREFQVEFLMQFAELKELTGEYQASVGVYLEALEVAKEHDLPPKVGKILKTLAALHEKHGNLNDALERFKEFHSVQEQLVHAQAARHLSGMQVLHEIEIHRKNEEIARSQITNLESLIKVSNQSILLYKKEFNNLKSEILTITALKDSEESLIRKIKMKLRESPLMQETWESYLEIFSRVNPDFQETLMNKYPNLTMMEERVCVLIRAGLMSDEIAEILSLSERTIENKRLRIRKKVGLDSKGSLSRFLMQL